MALNGNYLIRVILVAHSNLYKMGIIDDLFTNTE